MNTLRLALVLLTLGGSSAISSAAEYARFVTVESVEARYINGEIRFCEHRRLRGTICGDEAWIFGKRFMPSDWWSPETYVQAVTGAPRQIVHVEPYNAGLIIYFN